MGGKSILRLCGWLSALCALCTAPTVWAHHSTAMFDYSKSETLMGTVKLWQYKNPHSYLQILVPDGKGGSREWSIEAGPVSAAGVRRGWTHDAFKVGDKVTVVIAPMKDGTRAGTIRTATFANGRVLTSLTANIGLDRNGQPGFNLKLPEIKRSTPKPPAERNK